jgi:uncharacterized protein DUF4214
MTDAARTPLEDAKVRPFGKIRSANLHMTLERTAERLRRARADNEPLLLAAIRHDVSLRRARRGVGALFGSADRPTFRLLARRLLALLQGRAPEAISWELVRNPDVDAFICEAYNVILRREPDADGWRSYREGLIDGGLTRYDVINTMLRSSEARRCWIRIRPDLRLRLFRARVFDSRRKRRAP